MASGDNGLIDVGIKKDAVLDIEVEISLGGQVVDYFNDSLSSPIYHSVEAIGIVCRYGRRGKITVRLGTGNFRRW